MATPPSAVGTCRIGPFVLVARLASVMYAVGAGEVNRLREQAVSAGAAARWLVVDLDAALLPWANAPYACS